MKLALTAAGEVDLQRVNGRLAQETALNTAVIVSLLTDRRALPDDRLPDDPQPVTLLPPDRRGWCGDALAETAGERIGSRLWLLRREKQTEETRRRAIDYCKEALQWMIDDGHAVSVPVVAEWADTYSGRLNVHIEIVLPDGTTYSLDLPIGGFHAV